MEAIGLSKFMEETKSAVKDSWGRRPHDLNMLIPFHTDLMGGVSKFSRGGVIPPINFWPYIACWRFDCEAWPSASSMPARGEAKEHCKK